MTTQIVIDLANDFGRYPAGRFTNDGPFSGQRFRDEVLLPRLRQSEPNVEIVIDLDGARGFGSSFLEEAFGGLVRVHHLDKRELQRRLKFKCRDTSLEVEARHYIDDAQPTSH